jgi:dipeptidyl aminopeptidase/acylaminoacyl peptidase
MADREKVWDEVSFFSDGLKIAAHLYTPADWQPGDPPRPGIVVLHGYSGMKDVYGMDVPRRLWEEGYFVLAPDHRGFGDSEGARGRHRPLEQAQDVYDAFTFLETIDGADRDRLGLYGTSWGGASAIWCSAFDKRIKVVVNSVGVSDGERWLQRARRPAEWQQFQHEVAEAARTRVVTGEPTLVPLLDLMLTDPHTKGVIQDHHQKHTHYVPDYDLESAEACMRFSPESVAHLISPRPVLVIYAEDDCTVPPEEQFGCFAALGEPKKLVMLPGAQHYESYFFCNEETHQIGMSEAVAWFAGYL